MVVQKINGNLILDSPHINFNARVENVWSSPAVECLEEQHCFNMQLSKLISFFLKNVFIASNRFL